MPPGVDNFVAPGLVGLIIAIAYVLKLATDWWSKRGDTRRMNAEAIANGEEWLIQRLQESLTDEREEVARLSGRVQELETQNALLYERMREQRREYEREVADLRSQMSDMASRLEDLQRRLSADPPAL